MVNIDKVDLIHKFVQAYNSAQDSIEENKHEEAKQKYHELMQIYKQISDSDMEPVHKELAYDQVMKVFNGIKGIKMRSAISGKSIALAVVIILISLVIFIKPEIVGLAVGTISSIDSAPYWNGDSNLFVITGVPKSAMFKESYDRTINLDSFFTDSNGDELSYLATSAPGLDVRVKGSFLTFLPQKGVFGDRTISVVASDGEHVVKQELAVSIVKP